MDKLITVSDGVQVNGNGIDRKVLKRKQRAISRSVKGSNLRRKRVIAFQREWQRVADRTKGFNHELTADMKIQSMIRSPHLTRVITEQNWGDFVTKLTYKAESAGGYVVRVDPKFTSQNCSHCNMYDSNTKNSYSIFECSECGFVTDRDLNASRNVLQRGLAHLSGGVQGA